MNKVAWNISFEKQINFEIEDLCFVESENLNWTYTYFFYWKTYIDFASDILKKLEEKAQAKSINHDISIEAEDNIEIYTYDQVDWIYTITSIEWNEENFDSVIEKFAESSPFIISIRESETSPRFWNRVIKIDIIN